MSLHIVIGTKTYSSWSLRGWLAVAHTGLPFRETKLALDTEEFYREIEAFSPTKCVPALQDGDIQVWDSLAIIDYCAHLAPEKNWWPTGKAAYARARSICAEMHSGFMALRGAAPMNFRGSWKDLTLSEAVQRDVNRIDQIWQECREGFGQAGAFLFGEFGAADMMYAPVASRFRTYGIQLSPISQAYVDSILNHPLVLQWQEDEGTETQVVAQDEISANATQLG